MTLYLYALAARPAVLPHGGGIDGSPLAVEGIDGMDAVVSRLDLATVEPTQEAVLAHARVVEGLAAANAAVLPAQFGRGFADGDSLRAAVLERADDLGAALERVRDCVELSVRILRPAAQAENANAEATGRGYMQARLEERRRANELASGIDQPLARLARAATKSVLATPELLLSAAYLVPRADVDTFRATLADAERAHADLSVVCTGPWPPYSFATAEAASR